MRIIRILTLVVLLSVALGVYADEAARFNVATYNLRQLNGDDTKAGNGWERRCPVVAQLIRFHDFDIFGTQEGFRSQLDELQALLPGYKYIGVGRDDGKFEGEHSAIFYRTDLFDLIDHGDFWLSETPDRPGLGWDAACVRICTWGQFRHKPSGREFLFYNLHMDHVGTVARVESANLIKRRMVELGHGLPVVLTGDFNVDQTSPSYATIVADSVLVDSHEVADMVYQLNGTFNDYRTSGYTPSRIDHIFVSPSVTVEKYGVLTDTYRTPAGDTEARRAANAPDEVMIMQYDARTPSDHFPVRATIRVR